MDRPAPNAENCGTAAALSRRDRLLLAAYCTLLFGLSLVGGRPLTMHEGVLPETSREMAIDRDWIIPKNGGRPWMENPPLPQWITVAIGAVCGGCDRVWVVRIGPALAATLIVVLLANMAARWFGRHVGVLSGIVLATTYEFTQYAWLAEDEIYLCALCTLAVDAFTRTEFFRGDSAAPGSRNPFGMRPWSLVWLFVALGLTNLAKGILFGAVMAGAPMLGFLLWNRDLRRIGFYIWFCGIVVFLLLVAVWPLAAIWRIPEAADVWKFDHVGRLDGSYTDLSQPWYYYLKVLPGNLAPWTLLVPFGMYVTHRKALFERYSPERFLWCWALLPIVVFSVPSGKHHHYLLQCTAPWAVLAARSLPWLHAQIQAWPARRRNPLNSLATLVVPGECALWLLRNRIGGPAWLVPTLLAIWPVVAVGFSWATAHRRGAVAATILMAVVTLGFVVGHLYAGAYADQCIEDTKFLQAVPGKVPGGQPILVNADLHCLDECRIQFYIGDRARALHNLTFLADERLPSSLYLISRAEDEVELAQYGNTEIVSQSSRSRRERSPGSRLTLFHLRLRDDLPRFPATEIRVTPMQAMGRAAGPFLGKSVSEGVRR